MSRDAQAATIIELAEEFIDLVFTIDEKWTKAFYRFCRQTDHYGAAASCMLPSKVDLIDPLRHSSFYESMANKCLRLLMLLDANTGVILLTVEPNMEYKIDFELNDLNRWKISKLNGGTGVPV